MGNLSKTQIDKLGERLKKGDVTEFDLRLLDQYRKSFSEAYEFVVHVINSGLNLAPTGRRAKSTPSIIQKLLRESIRLTQIQDIAGCRLIVPDMEAQDKVVSAIKNSFDQITMIDRRTSPSHGYRAVHAVVKYEEKLVEIQIRTELQHTWAEMSEKLADQLGSSLKYGEGEPAIVKFLMRSSSLFGRTEELKHGKPSRLPEDVAKDARSLMSELDLIKAEFDEFLDQTKKSIEVRTRKDD